MYKAARQTWAMMQEGPSTVSRIGRANVDRRSPVNWRVGEHRLSPRDDKAHLTICLCCFLSSSSRDRHCGPVGLLPEARRTCEIVYDSSEHEWPRLHSRWLVTRSIKHTRARHPQNWVHLSLYRVIHFTFDCQSPASPAYFG